MTNEQQHEEGGVYTYAGYTALGGRIDEANYTRVMEVAKEDSDVPGGYATRQTQTTAEISGVSLDAIRDETGIDPRSIYAILRADMVSGAEHHHGQMSDQELLVESLRMLGQGEAAQAIITKHPHITFN